MELFEVFLFNYNFDHKTTKHFDKAVFQWERTKEVTNVSVRFTFHIIYFDNKCVMTNLSDIFSGVHCATNSMSGFIVKCFNGYQIDIANDSMAFI